MDQLFNSVIEQFRSSFPLHDVALDPELAKPKSFLKVLDATHYNWTADRFDKLFGMRFKVKLPPLDQLNTIFYPEPCYETPIFLFFCLVTKRKVIAHIGLNCPFSDAAYLEHWVGPLLAMQQQYGSFEAMDRYPEWMKKYRQECTIMGMYPKDRLDDIGSCARDYLTHYLQRAAETQPETDQERLATIAAFHDQFRKDIRTQDKAQGMIAKMIGKQKARRIFYEITT